MKVKWKRIFPNRFKLGEAESWSFLNGRCYIDSGRLILKSLSSDPSSYDKFAVAELKSINLRNLRISAKLRIIEKGEDPWVGFKVRSRVESHFDGYLVYIRGDGRVDLFNGWKDYVYLDRDWRAPHNPSDNEVNIGAIFYEDQYEVSANGKKLITGGDDETIRTGRIYFLSHMATSMITGLEVFGVESPLKKISNAEGKEKNINMNLTKLRQLRAELNNLPDDLKKFGFVRYKPYFRTYNKVLNNLEQYDDFKSLIKGLELPLFGPKGEQLFTNTNLSTLNHNISQLIISLDQFTTRPVKIKTFEEKISEGVYTRLDGKGNYEKVNWQEFFDLFQELLNLLSLRTFEGSANPPVLDEYTRKHWGGAEGKRGFGDLMILEADRNWSDFRFRFYDTHDDSRFIRVEVDCNKKSLTLSGSLDNRGKLLRALEKIMETFSLRDPLDFEFVPTEVPNMDAEKTVFVIHGRNEKIRREVFDFLKAIGLRPLEWNRAVALTKNGSPYIGEILDAAFNNAQAVLALLTPDDLVKLKDEFIKGDDPPYEKELTPQARPNVIFEAGMSLGRNPDRLIIVEFGKVRPFSDIAGRHVIKMDSSPERKKDLALRLKTAGCQISLEGTDWLKVGDFDLNENQKF